ncbi:MAG: sigma-70 family RNA polymerase sigma factor [Bacteroidia bacterium]|nr:sigma-70 family RNA polymerase sigma factor [Bacteroidia bacterium]
MNQTQVFTENELIKQLKLRQNNAFTWLYDHYASALFTVIKRNIQNDDQASDLLQEVFIKIYNNIDRYDHEKGRLFTWMMNLTRNLCIDYLRSQTNKNQEKNQNIENSVNTIDSAYSAVTEINAIGLKKIIERLPEQQSEILDFVYFQGYTQQETSDKLNIPLGTVKTKLRMAIITLRGVFKSGL